MLCCPKNPGQMSQRNWPCAPPPRCRSAGLTPNKRRRARQEFRLGAPMPTCPVSSSRRLIATPPPKIRGRRTSATCHTWRCCAGCAANLMPPQAALALKNGVSGLWRGRQGAPPKTAGGCSLFASCCGAWPPFAPPLEPWSSRGRGWARGPRHHANACAAVCATGSGHRRKHKVFHARAVAQETPAPVRWRPCAV